ncbi:MAG: IPT/TIG domain-containing protein [Dehalococcoidales bacterium]
MKSAHMLRLIGLIVVIALLVMAVPVTAQTRTIEIDPEEGTIGTTVTIAGEGFNKSTDTTDRYAVIFFSSEEASTLDDIDSDVTIYEVVRDGIWLDENGEFGVDFNIPDELNDGDDDEDVVAGTYYIYICHYNLDTTIATRIRAVAEFTVLGGDIIIDPEEGPVGSEVEITGEEFLGNEDLVITYDDDEIDIESGDDDTDSDGEFASTVLIPESTVGAHTIKVTVGSSEAEAEFTVESEVILDPTSGEAGTDVSVSGTGFGRRSDVVAYFDAEGVVTGTTSSDGSFEATFTVPELDKGIYDVEAEDDDGNLDTAKFTITVPEPTQPTQPAPTPTPTPTPSTTAINVSATSGKVGSDLIITGAGFAASGTVTIEFGDEVLDTVAADASGIFVAILEVPSAKAGEHTISVSDGTYTDEVTFTVEGVPPPIPMPLLPQMGVKAETPVIFDWENVTVDAGSANYALQVATDDDFAEDAIVLEKTSLTKSEYTTTEAESIALASREDVYYWRVRAIDAADTEGEWTGAGEFYVSKPFSFPTWALYTLLGLGALVLFGVGYWMGRRTAYYY